MLCRIEVILRPHCHRLSFLPGAFSPLSHLQNERPIYSAPALRRRTEDRSVVSQTVACPLPSAQVSVVAPGYMTLALLASTSPRGLLHHSLFVFCFSFCAAIHSLFPTLSLCPWAVKTRRGTFPGVHTGSLARLPCSPAMPPMSALLNFPVTRGLP